MNPYLIKENWNVSGILSGGGDGDAPWYLEVKGTLLLPNRHYDADLIHLPTSEGAQLHVREDGLTYYLLKLNVFKIDTENTKLDDKTILEVQYATGENSTDYQYGPSPDLVVIKNEGDELSIQIEYDI